MTCTSENIDIEDFVTEKKLYKTIKENIILNYEESSEDLIPTEDYFESFNKNHDKPDENKMKLLIDEILKKDLNTSPHNIDEIFRVMKKKYRLLPSKADIRYIFNKFFKDIEIPLKFRKWMIKKSVRSNSGVLVATITLSPHTFSCKYDCSYCPQETDLSGKFTQPRSYLSNEPAMLRALQFDFDVKGQFWDRIKAYTYTGNIVKDNTSSYKMEIILSGGTWESYPKDYREKVMNELYWSANTYDNNRPMKTLEEEIIENETATYRIIGLTIETRPDNITKEAIQDYRRWGVTRIQIGVQHIDDEILRNLNRKCYTKDTIKALRLLKQCGFKIVVHLMPDLPGSSPEKDKWMFDQVLTREDLQFDDVKLYPTAVCKSSDSNLIVKSKIADWYKNGTYIPYGEKNLDDLVNVLIYYKERINPWVRIQRLVRDIPSKGIEAGYNKMSNLRQYILDRMAKHNIKCVCIRCMEIGNKEFDNYKQVTVVNKYNSSQGMEYHISIEAHTSKLTDILDYFVNYIVDSTEWLVFGDDIYSIGNRSSYIGLYGFLRLRLDPEPGGVDGEIIPELKGCALIRELHVYGQSVGIGKDGTGSQHRGYGMKLMKIAEGIAASNGYTKVAVIAGVGTREYYKNKCGYSLEGTYMIKNISKHDFKFMLRFFITTVIMSLTYYWVAAFFKYMTRRI